MKKVAVMNDLSGFGKCSLTAAIPVLSALGVQCCPLPSAVLTNQTGYPHYHYTDLSDMLPILQSFKKCFDLSYIEVIDVLNDGKAGNVIERRML